MKLRMKVAGITGQGANQKGLTLYPADHASTNEFYKGAPRAGSVILTVPTETADAFKVGQFVDCELTPLEMPDPTNADQARPAGGKVAERKADPSSTIADNRR